MLEASVYKASDIANRLFGDFSNPEKLSPAVYLAGNSFPPKLQKA